jgi:hypothetical protein
MPHRRSQFVRQVFDIRSSKQSHGSARPADASVTSKMADESGAQNDPAKSDDGSQVKRSA